MDDCQAVGSDPLARLYIPVEQAATRAGEYFQALTNGTNPGAVYAGWTSDYFKETTDQPLFAKYLSENPIVYQVDYIEFTHQAEETIEIGNIVALQGNVYAEDGSTAILEAHLIKEEGEYKMLYFSFTYPESTDEEEA